MIPGYCWIHNPTTVFKIRSETCRTEGQFCQNLYMTKKESLLGPPKFYRSRSAVQHLFWKLLQLCLFMFFFCFVTGVSLPISQKTLGPEKMAHIFQLNTFKCILLIKKKLIVWFRFHWRSLQLTDSMILVQVRATSHFLNQWKPSVWHRVITWMLDDPAHRCFHTSPGFNELRISQCQ